MIVYGNVAGIIHRELQPMPDDAPGKPRHHWSCKRVVLDGALVFGSVGACADAIGCLPTSLSRSLREGRRCCGHEVAFVDETEGAWL